MEQVLQQQFRHEIPQGAVFLTRQEILQYHSNLINNWKPWTDIWPLHIGRSILAGATSLGALYLNYRFRRKLRFLYHGTVPTTITFLTVPAMVTAIVQGELFIKKLFLFETHCSLCLQTRSVLLQNFSGLIVPLILIPLANFAIAPGSTVVNIPLARDVKAVIKFIGSAYQPLLPVITSMFIFHSLLAGFISYKQIKSFVYLHNAQYFLSQSEKQNCD